MSDYEGKTAEELLAILTERDRHIKELNAESASRRLRIQELEQAGAGNESLKAERDAAVSSLREYKINTAVVGKARELGFAHPEDVLRLADLSKVEISEGGEVTGFSLDELAKSGRLPMAGQSIGTITRSKVQGAQTDPLPGGMKVATAKSVW